MLHVDRLSVQGSYIWEVFNKTLTQELLWHFKKTRLAIIVSLMQNIAQFQLSIKAIMAGETVCVYS